MRKKWQFLSLMAVSLMLTSVLAVGCRGTDSNTGLEITGYSTQAPTVQPTPLAVFGKFTDPVALVTAYFNTFNDTVSFSDANQRFQLLYTLMVPNTSDPCDKQRFITMQKDIKDSTGTYSRAEQDGDMIQSSDGMSATVKFVAATTFNTGDQIFALAKQSDGGYLIKQIDDQVNYAGHDWPPDPAAGWQSQFTCADSGSSGDSSGSTGVMTGTDATADTTPTPLPLAPTPQPLS